MQHRVGKFWGEKQRIYSLLERKIVVLQPKVDEIIFGGGGGGVCPPPHKKFLQVSGVVQLVILTAIGGHFFAVASSKHVVCSVSYSVRTKTIGENSSVT
jgi:hypothetical protein